MISVPSSDTPANGPTLNQQTIATAEATAWKSGPVEGLFWALIAGLMAWILVQTFHPVFWTTEGMDEVGFLTLAVQWTMDRDDAMLVDAVLGGLTSGGVAMCECV